MEYKTKSNLFTTERINFLLQQGSNSGGGSGSGSSSNVVQQQQYNFVSLTRDTVHVPNLYWGVNVDAPLNIIQTSISDVMAGNSDAGIV